MIRSLSIVALLSAFVVHGSAHEYWIEPDSFFLKPNERTPIRLLLGMGLKKEEERPFQSSKTTLFRLISSDTIFDMTTSVQDNDLPLFTYSSATPGNHLLAMERSWSYITLEPKQFDEYLREDGMEYIIAEREKRGESAKSGKERYSRYIKSLLQVGDKRDKAYAKHVGLRLEIVPLENPYSKKVGESLPLQVLFDGKPLGGKVAFADNRDGDTFSHQKLETDGQGKLRVKLDRKGVWLVRLVFMQRCAKACEGADWESFWGAFSFGVK